MIGVEMNWSYFNLVSTITLTSALLWISNLNQDIIHQWYLFLYIFGIALCYRSLFCFIYDVVHAATLLVISCEPSK